jgi:hypothetical protein
MRQITRLYHIILRGAKKGKPTELGNKLDLLTKWQAIQGKLEKQWVSERQTAVAEGIPTV